MFRFNRLPASFFRLPLSAEETVKGDITDQDQDKKQPDLLSHRPLFEGQLKAGRVLRRAQSAAFLA